MMKAPGSASGGLRVYRTCLVAPIQAQGFSSATRVAMAMLASMVTSVRASATVPTTGSLLPGRSAVGGNDQKESGAVAVRGGL